MKRILGVVAVLVLLASISYGSPTGQGGIVYWDRPLTSGSRITMFQLYSATFDSTFTQVGSSVNFDNVLMNGNSYAFSTNPRDRNVEVYDPRVNGGTGSLLVADLYDNTPPVQGGPFWNSAPPTSRPDYMQPWDILRVNPTTHVKTLLTSGRMSGSGWNTVGVEVAVAAPADWRGKTTNGISIVTEHSAGLSNQLNHQWDANASGQVDNSASEGVNLNATGDDFKDMEFAGDGTLYYSRYRYPSSTNPYQVKRVFVNNQGVATNQVYFNISGLTNPVTAMPGGSAVDGLGLAIKNMGVGQAPIVYLMAAENATGRTSIWALRDGDADNKVDPADVNDTIARVWRNGEKGISITNIYGEDVEYTSDGTNQTLLFNSYYNALYALELTDNGLAVRSAKTIIAPGGGNFALGPAGYNSGFELDMNLIPEPGTMLLIGTGVVSLFGAVRRRRMK